MATGKHTSDPAGRRIPLQRYDFSRSAGLSFLLILGVLATAGLAVGVAALMAR
jgi:hypothetical protein